jgi:hypothetical protein
MPRAQEALARIIREFGEAASQLHLLVDGLPEDLWARRNDPNRWSVAECVAHLNLTGRAYVPLLREALDKARALPERNPGRYRRDPIGWLLSVTTGPLLRFGSFKLGSVKTTPTFVPEKDLPRARTLEEFDRLQAEQIDVARSSEGLAVHRVQVTSPFDRRIRYNLYSALVILPRHQIRHVQQAEAVWA